MATGSKGNCYICGTELSMTAMENHVLKAHSEEDNGQVCNLLKIEGTYSKDYWLFLDIPVNRSLSDVDKFLRKIWLECCGHLSAFRVSGQGEVKKTCTLSSFSVGDSLLHEYDFGTTTESVVTIVGTIKRKPQKENVRLIARNIPPHFECEKCGSPAEFVCTECAYSSDNPFYCATCGDMHEHDEMLLPVTNSPRMGECGYDGEMDTFAFIAPEMDSGGRHNDISIKS